MGWRKEARAAPINKDRSLLSIQERLWMIETWGLCEHEALRYTWMKAETLNVQIQSAMDATNAWTKSIKFPKNQLKIT